MVSVGIAAIAIRLTTLRLPADRKVAAIWTIVRVASRAGATGLFDPFDGNRNVAVFIKTISELPPVVVSPAFHEPRS
jgi:hypothetical protein